MEGKIGGDAPLSESGRKYSDALPGLLSQIAGDAPLTVSLFRSYSNAFTDMFAKIWTSTLQRTIETARQLNYTKLTWKSLDELDAGVCDGMTYEEIAVCLILVIIYVRTLIPAQENYPEDFEARDEDKFNYRYRGGESYRDIVVRLEPVIMELERQENILIVCHQVSILAILDFDIFRYNLASLRLCFVASTRISTTFPKRTCHILKFLCTRLSSSHPKPMDVTNSVSRSLSRPLIRIVPNQNTLPRRMADLLRRHPRALQICPSPHRHERSL